MRKKLFDRWAAAGFWLTKEDFDTADRWVPELFPGFEAVPVPEVLAVGPGYQPRPGEGAWKLQLDEGQITIVTVRTNQAKGYALQLSVEPLHLLPQAKGIAAILVERGLELPGGIPPFDFWDKRAKR